MLRLFRHTGEKVIIDVPPSTGTTRVEITMLNHDARSAEIGLDTPRDCLILRRELLDNPRPAKLEMIGAST